MPECIFCERQAGNTEHVFPQWILNRKEMGHSRLQIGNRQERILKNITLLSKPFARSATQAG
jgi:hypothetical protein